MGDPRRRIALILRFFPVDVDPPGDDDEKSDQEENPERACIGCEHPFYVLPVRPDVQPDVPDKDEPYDVADRRVDEDFDESKPPDPCRVEKNPSQPWKEPIDDEELPSEPLIPSMQFLHPPRNPFRSQEEIGASYPITDEIRCESSCNAPSKRSRCCQPERDVSPPCHEISHEDRRITEIGRKDILEKSGDEYPDRNENRFHGSLESVGEIADEWDFEFLSFESSYDAEDGQGKDAESDEDLDDPEEPTEPDQPEEEIDRLEDDEKSDPYNEENEALLGVPFYELFSACED